MHILIGIGIYLFGVISGAFLLGIAASGSYDKGYEDAKSMESEE